MVDINKKQKIKNSRKEDNLKKNHQPRRGKTRRGDKRKWIDTHFIYLLYTCIISVGNKVIRPDEKSE